MTKRIETLYFADDKAGRFWAAFFEQMEQVKRTTPFGVWSICDCYSDHEAELREDALALDAIERQYNEAKSINPEKAYPLLRKFSNAENDYRLHLADLRLLFSSYHGRRYKIDPEKGSVWQIAHWQSLREQAEKHLDYVELGVREYSARERIDAKAAAKWTRVILAQIKAAWSHAETQFKEREKIT